jgi:hypothetical protein
MASSPLPFLGEPPTRPPKPVTEVPAVRGKRVILSRPEGFMYDVRAVSEVYTDDDGKKRVQVCGEEAYYRWMLTDVTPVVRSYPAYLVWVE